MNERQLRHDAKVFLLVPLFLLLTLIFAPTAPAQDNLDLQKAVKVGSGKVMVVEFTDPDCPYCRKAETFFQGQPQVTRYIFFYPLSMHPEAKSKVQYILSANDKAKAYLEVMSGHFDNSKLASITPEGVKLQQEHYDISLANKVDAVPIFMIYGRIVKGFDPNRLQPLLK